MSDAKYLIGPLGRQHNRAAFSCGEEPLDRYVREQALRHIKQRIAAVFVLNDAEADRIIGYYTLSAFTIELTRLPETMAKRLPRYPLVPVTLLGRLAVDSTYQKRGYGEILLVDALRRSLTQAVQVGSMAVVVDAKNDDARRWYERYGFQHLADNDRQLYLAMSTIASIF
jgi:GNAT superfamily N-acetyltransferase